ncbi:CapA family protein [Bdellovibrio sp.]|uniref:CapA family protein n=1 Tax=Bdellovibrio sp. TaxID=28201 RepID=UPI0039E32B9E
MKTLIFSTLMLLGFSSFAQEVSLSFVGDIMLADGPGKYIKQGGDPFKEFRQDLKKTDFAIGNLECPVSTKGQELKEKPVTFRAHPSSVRVLKDLFHAVGLANNHTGDYGTEAFLETLDVLNKNQIHSFGGGKNLKEAHRALYLEKNGLKIAVLAYNDFKPRSFEASSESPGLAWLEDDQVLQDFAEVKKQGADVIIPFLHWGWEYEGSPNQRQIEIARLMIDNGASIVVGGHPHVTQKFSEYKGKKIIWSLGNFVFDGFPEGPRRVGWLLQFTATKNSVKDLKVIRARLSEGGIPHRDGEVDLKSEEFSGI